MRTARRSSAHRAVTRRPVPVAAPIAGSSALSFARFARGPARVPSDRCRRAGTSSRTATPSRVRQRNAWNEMAVAVHRERRQRLVGATGTPRRPDRAPAAAAGRPRARWPSHRPRRAPPVRPRPGGRHPRPSVASMRPSVRTVSPRSGRTRRPGCASQARTNAAGEIHAASSCQMRRRGARASRPAPAARGRLRVQGRWSRAPRPASAAALMSDLPVFRCAANPRPLAASTGLLQGHPHAAPGQARQQVVVGRVMRRQQAGGQA